MFTYLHFFSLILFLFLLVSSAIAIFIPQESTNSSLTILENECQLRSIISPVPEYNDCIRAIGYLPTRPQYEQGPFHNGPPEDPYHLPATKIYNTCMVRVELHAGRAVFKASWVGVKGAAWLLNKACLKPFSSLGQLYAGGWTTWGRHERIVITLAYPDELNEVGGGRIVTIG